MPTNIVYTDGEDGKWSVWGASMVKGEDGLYHIFYSRWPKAMHWAWVTDSEIAHAVSSSPYGPFEFKDVTLPRRGKEYWDGWCTHNPTIHKFDGKYYLYYMGNTGDGDNPCVKGRDKINWQHRNNQRIGVAVADNPYGPWKRFDKPLIDVSSDPEAYDCLVTSNPSFCRMEDGRYLLIYKSVGTKFPLPNGGPVTHMCAVSDSPTGPFVKREGLVFYIEGERFPAEDPYIWYGDGRYHAIVKCIKTEGNKRLFSLVQYESEDGFDWKLSKDALVSEREYTRKDGTHFKLDHLERPQVFFENGEPTVLLCAADTLDSDRVRHSWNVQIPLVVKKTVVKPE